MADDNPDLRKLSQLTRAQLHRHAEHYFKSGGATEPEVALVACGEARAILKDYARTPGWFGQVIAPILIWREASALTRLAGLAGIPRLYRRMDRHGLLMEYLPGTPWPQAHAPEIAYERLAELVEAMHARGVAHCDLRAPSNTLVGADGTPYIVDFVARVHRGRRWNGPWNWLFSRFVAADDSALVKLRVRFAPQLATADDQAQLAEQGWTERVARAFGARVRLFVRYFVRSS